MYQYIASREFESCFRRGIAMGIGDANEACLATHGLGEAALVGIVIETMMNCPC